MKANSSCCSINRTNINNNNPLPTPMEITKNDKEIKFKDKMVQIAGDEFLMGTTQDEGFPSDGEGPIHKVIVSSFLIDKYCVTNEEFWTFIEETGYVTDAEKFGWSYVFYQFLSPLLLQQMPKVPHTPWWYGVKGAYWKEPEGPGSSINDRMNHPVVHISWNDANAFCNWAGKRLPTEAEWEYAARGGLERKKYPWGNELTPNGEHYCNIWQGIFPRLNTEDDGYLGTAPSQSFPPNGYGLYNVSGNVWEWCSDWFTSTLSERGGQLNPKGPKDGETKVMKGGSYLCHESYCNRYRVAARTSNTPDSSSGHLGFRCVADLKK